MTKWKRDFLILGAAYFILAALALVALSVMAQAQTCTPPIGQGSVNAVSNCHYLQIRWLNRQPSHEIDRYVVRWTFDGLQRTLPGSAVSDTRGDLPGGVSSQLQITQYNKNGAVCSMTTTTTPAPHTPQCGSGGGGASAGISIVSSANFRGQVSRGSLASLFPDPGTTFTDRQEFATTFNLPTTLGGVTVEVPGEYLTPMLAEELGTDTYKGRMALFNFEKLSAELLQRGYGFEVHPDGTLGVLNTFCKLLAVAPGQVNILLPDSLPDGPTEVPIVVNSTRGTTARFTGRAQLNPQAPGIFTASANGEGRAASLWLVIYPSGGFNYFNNLPALNGSEQVFLLLYGTGVRGTQAELRLGNGRTFASHHVGSASFAGLEQLTFRIPTADLWRSEIGAVVRVFAPAGGWHETQGFLVR